MKSRHATDKDKRKEVEVRIRKEVYYWGKKNTKERIIYIYTIELQSKEQLISFKYCSTVNLIDFRIIILFYRYKNSSLIIINYKVK